MLGDVLVQADDLLLCQAQLVLHAHMLNFKSLYMPCFKRVACMQMRCMAGASMLAGHRNAQCHSTPIKIR